MLYSSASARQAWGAPRASSATHARTSSRETHSVSHVPGAITVGYLPSVVTSGVSLRWTRRQHVRNEGTAVPRTGRHGSPRRQLQCESSGACRWLSAAHIKPDCLNVPALVGAHWQLTQSVRGASVDCEPDALSNSCAAVEPRDAKRVQEAELRVRQSTTREAGLVSAFLPSQQA